MLVKKFADFIKRNKMFFVALFIANPIAFLTNYVIYNPSSNQDKLDCILFSFGMSILIITNFIKKKNTHCFVVNPVY